MASSSELEELGIPKGVSIVNETLEERCFSAALICLDGHFHLSPPIGPQTAAKVSAMITKTLEKTHNFKHARDALSRNVAIWVWMTRIFAAAIPTLSERSVGPLSSMGDLEKGMIPQENTTLIIKHYASIKDDLQILNKLMHIARNLLVTSDPEVPQDICAAVAFDQMVYQTIILCVNVTGKGYGPDMIDEPSRAKLTEISELYKRMLVTALQMAHNWIAKNDRNKMSFWHDVLLEEYNMEGGHEDTTTEDPDFQVEIAKRQVQHWIERHSTLCDKARILLQDYAKYHADKPPGPLAPIGPLAWNWLPEGTVKVRADEHKATEKITPVWNPAEKDPFEQDRAYGRVSREIDSWWLRARDENYEDWVKKLPTVDDAKALLKRANDQLKRYHEAFVATSPSALERDGTYHAAAAVAKVLKEKEAHFMLPSSDDLDSINDAPLPGLLTEIPNILDPKQIEALHMIIKSCILDTAGSGLTRAGENLQKTRCRMFAALVCGRSLLREMLVFIAVWEKEEQSLVYQITTHIIEALHHSALIPFVWGTLRIPKDIVSPAQTVMLRLINYMFRARINSPPAPASRESLRDVKLVQYFFDNFRSRVVPECVALMNLQGDIREESRDPMEFPADTWDMERAKEGLAQYLEFLTTVAELTDTRAKMIEWEAVYELISLLNGLEYGVPKKPLVEPTAAAADAAQKGTKDGSKSTSTTTSPSPTPSPGPSSTALIERPYASSGEGDGVNAGATPAHLQDNSHEYAWAGIKGQILTIIATLLQPPPGKSSPGNTIVQEQILRHNGMVPLLNCCTYDDHNPFAKERVTVCLKWLLDGSEGANKFLRQLINVPPSVAGSPGLSQPGGSVGGNASPIMNVRVDGIPGEVKVKVRPKSVPTDERRPTAVLEAPTDEVIALVTGAAQLNIVGSPDPGNQPGRFSEDDFM